MAGRVRHGGHAAYLLSRVLRHQPHGLSREGRPGKPQGANPGAAREATHLGARRTPYLAGRRRDAKKLGGRQAAQQVLVERLLRADRNALLDLLTSGAHDERADAILHATNQKAGVSSQKGGRRPRETGGWACSFSGRMVTGLCSTCRPCATAHRPFAFRAGRRARRMFRNSSPFPRAGVDTALKKSGGGYSVTVTPAGP